MKPRSRADMVCSGSLRSISPPLESDAIMIRIGVELKKLQTREESSTSVAEAISIGLSGIADLYNCICNMLTLPLTHQVLSLHQHQSCVGELLEVSSQLLEICSATREMALQMEESSRDLRSALGGTNEYHKSSISRYIFSRKKIMKATKQTLLSLKRIGGESFVSLQFSGDVDERVSTVIQALRCISIMSISIHENILYFLGLKPKSGGKRPLLSKLICIGKGACGSEEVSRNEVENVDVAICGLLPRSEEKRRLACKRLDALEGGIEGIESGLECVFRQLTQTRVLLLKIVSH